MFNRIKCSACNNKIKKNFNYCPNCGRRNQTIQQLGLLGKEDSLNSHQPIKIPQKQGMIDSIISKVMSSAIQAIEKEVQKDLAEINNSPKQNFQLVVNGKSIDPATLGIVPPQKEKITQEPKKVSVILSDEKRKKIQEMKKSEPKTSVRRFSDKIVYEMNMPGVKSLQDVSINQLNNSIEIKAIGNKKAYEKIISISLPIRQYSLAKGKLTLELIS